MNPLMIVGADTKLSAKCGKGVVDLLYVRHAVIAHVPARVSAWEAGLDEAGWLAAGAALELALAGKKGEPHPMISMSIGEPPTDGPPVWIVRQAMKNGRTEIEAMMYCPARPDEGKHGGSVTGRADFCSGGRTMGEAIRDAVDAAMTAAKKAELV